jgi:protein TonB
MITPVPCALLHAAPARQDPDGRADPHVAGPATATRYGMPRPSRANLATAAVLSAALHAAVLLGFGPAHHRPAAPALPAEQYLIRLVIPDLKDLEEPEPAPAEGSAPPADLGVLVPLQADLPRIPQPSDFVQTLNFASLVEQPDFSQLKVYAVPEHIRNGGTRLAEQIGRIFNLSDLDRVPQPVFQPTPQFPFAMRRESHTGTVTVEFIVDVNGVVLEPVARDSTHPGFNEAALSGVSRWKFRPGLRGGQKVNTRMRVPIIFRFSDELP